MIKDRSVLEEYLEKQCDSIVMDNEKCKALYTYANKTYDIPKGIVMDLVSKRMLFEEVSEFVLFILLDSFCNIIDNKRKRQPKHYYTDQEIKYYQKSKYIIDEVKFPMEFKMVQVEEDQWIGKINVKKLMQLRRAQLINYNVNAQRTMQRIVRGEKESFKISLNHKAVSQIAESFEQNEFIPNTITLNIPLETDYDFSYDEENCSLVIKSLDHFDITDGFHRYIAASQVSDLNKDFDYNMELRIVNYTEDKAKQFIFQEDQKTQMRKVDSDSLNMNKAANIVVTRLNENVRCNLKGLISRNDGIIPFGELAELVDYFYFRDVKKEKERIATIRAVNELTENFNILTEYNTKYLEEKMDFRTLATAMYCFDYFRDNDDKIKMCEVIEKAADALNNSDKKRKVVPKKVKNYMIAEVENAVKEVM